MADGYVVEAAGVTKRFRDSRRGALLTAVDCLDIRAARGKMTALIGPDGAGKTTFLRMVCGLMFPTEGILSVLGISVADKPADVQRRLGYMPQRFGLYEDLTCMENMNLYADLHGISAEERKERFEKLFHMTGLAPFAQRLAGKLSGGMKQKLGLACTLVRTPELLVLDEPTVGVDPLSRRELWEILKELVAEEQISVLVSTAYMEEAELCNEVYILNKGKLLDRGTPEELRKKTEGLCYTAKIPEGISPRILQAALLDDRESVDDAVPEKGNVRFILKKNEPLEKIKAFSYYPDLETESVPPRLEDSFMLALREAEEKENSLAGFEVDYKKHVLISEDVDIKVKNLVRRFGDFVAVDNTSFQVHKGEIFGLLGPNGAGKSTTFKMLCGLLPASSGELSVAGVNLRTARAAARANVGYVAQKFSLYGMLTVRENLEFFGGAYGMTRSRIKKRMEAVLSQFDLRGVENTIAGDLPGGYKQRLSMAAALLHEPKILFLDEPTSGIDPPARRIFWRQITALAAQGTTVIITTHFMDEAEYCDRIMIQDQGKMLILGTPEEVRRRGDENMSMNEAFIAIVEKNRREADL
ncbi:MAG: ABC transporter ATP-binding protein [Dialister invisus]|uniref:ATP-binding cassette domain-containing protein n=1 Tax=Dialister invisus TaxID=218538 RepID=UPI0013FCA1B7|nr:ATP-binding cassette domain-containing protein [Dialister invisus]MUU09696.1 ABC transporter ATP-binding protein [Dialister invisus]